MPGWGSMQKRCYYRLMGAGLLLCMGLTGCGLFPEEEAIRDTIRISHYVPVRHQTVKVRRGDVDSRQTVKLDYESNTSKDYYLKILMDDKVWDYGVKTYVVEGDLVKKGQLLAEAPCEDIEKEIRGYQEQLQAAGLELEHAQKLLEIAGEDEKTEYKNTIEDTAGTIEVLKLRIQEAEEKLSGYRIYADMDGKVTHIVDWWAGDYDPKDPFLRVLSVGGSFHGVAQRSICKLQEGDTVTAMLSSGETELKVEQIEDSAEDSVKLTLTADQPYDDTVTGRIQLEGDVQKNVLYVPQAAVAIREGKAYVRICGDDGYLRVKPVSVQGPVNGYYIVERGLEEGEEIVNE